MIISTLARKPLKGTVIDNVVSQGTGVINLDGCRILAGQDYENRKGELRFGAKEIPWMGNLQTRPWAEERERDGVPVKTFDANEKGRWPANLVLLPSTAEDLDRQSGWQNGTKSHVRATSTERGGNVYGHGMGGRRKGEPLFSYGDSGGASRYFLVLKE